MIRDRVGASSVVDAQLVDRPAPPSRVPRLWSAASLARRLDVSRSWVLSWHRSGVLRGHLLQAKPGTRGVVVFEEGDVLAFLESRGIPVDAREGEA